MAQAPDEKEALQHLLTKEGKPELRRLVDDTTTTAEMLQLFPSAKVPLEYLLDFVPAIKPRLCRTTVRTGNLLPAAASCCFQLLPTAAACCLPLTVARSHRGGAGTPSPRRARCIPTTSTRASSRRYHT